MRPIVRFIKRANPNAGGAVTSVLGPPPNTFFSMNGPFEYVHIVRDAVMLRCTVSIFYGLARAVLRTLFADLAEGLYAKIYGVIVNKREISKDLAEPNARAVFLSD